MGEDRTAEFLALSAKVSNKTASDEERARWRELRAELATPKKPVVAGQTPRAHVRATKKLRLHYALVSEMTVTFTDELGGGGLRLRSPKHLDAGTLLVVRVDLDDTSALTLEARVVWCKREGGHYNVGVEFPNLPAAEAERLEALLHRH